MDNETTNTESNNMNLIDINDLNNTELDALLGNIEEDAPCSVRIAYRTGEFMRDVASLRADVAAGELSTEDASEWLRLKHGAIVKF